MSRLRAMTLARMKELGMSPKRSMGQNFLVNDEVLSRILARFDLDRLERTIEIGPGLGAITDELLKRDANLVVIELDRVLAGYWRQRNATVFETDALDLPWDEVFQNKRCLVISNLPFQISSRIVIEFSLRKSEPEIMILMFQREVAERLVAKTRMEDYGLLSVMCQTFWTLKSVTNAGTQDFYPQPQVGSRVVRFERKKLGVEIDRQGFLTFLKIAFAQRRKLLARNLEAGFEREKIRDTFSCLTLAVDSRAEQLDPHQLVGLYEVLRATHGKT